MCVCVGGGGGGGGGLAPLLNHAIKHLKNRKKKMVSKSEIYTSNSSFKWEADSAPPLPSHHLKRWVGSSLGKISGSATDKCIDQPNYFWKDQLRYPSSGIWYVTNV